MGVGREAFAPIYYMIIDNCTACCLLFALPFVFLVYLFCMVTASPYNDTIIYITLNKGGI